jgi:hypothetical protein
MFIVHVHVLVNPLTHGGGGYQPPVFERPVAQKVIKFKKS